MARNMVQLGRTLSATPVPVGGVKSGDPLLIGSAFGVCQYEAAEGETVELDVEGVWSLPKAAGAVAFGDKLYFVAASGLITKTAAGNTAIGFASAPAGADDPRVDVRLVP